MPRFKTVIRKARFQAVGWTGAQMKQAADGVIERGILPRVRAGLTVYDTPAPPLSSKYARRKRNKGLAAIRNWVYTGRTTRSMKTLEAQQNRAVIGFTDPETNKRAYINNARSRQFGLSPSDDRVKIEEFRKLPPFVRAVQVQ